MGERRGPSAAMVVRGFRLVRAETRRVGVELVGERSGGAGFTCSDRPGSSGPCRGAVRRLRPWSGRRKNFWGMPVAPDGCADAGRSAGFSQVRRLHNGQGSTGQLIVADSPVVVISVTEFRDPGWFWGGIMVG